MPTWFEGMPFGIAVAALFVIVLLRAQGTYWIGRGVTAGALHTRFADKLTGPRITRAIDLLNRWGLPVVTVSFLTVGFQTVANAAAGLTRMPWIRYTIAMVIGCVMWALIYATIGFAAFDTALVLAAHSPWLLVGVMVLVAAVIIAVVLARRRRRSPAPPDALAEDASAH
ncbi:MAG TPA: VTT domain-containing protein [Nakamurella sp.]